MARPSQAPPRPAAAAALGAALIAAASLLSGCDDGSSAAAPELLPAAGANASAGFLAPTASPTPAPTAPATCDNTDSGATDLFEDDCEDYSAQPQWCEAGKYEDEDFTAVDMCCACGGGTTKGGPAQTPPPTAAPAPTPTPPSPTPALPEQSKISALAWEHLGLLNQLRAAGYTCPDGTSFAPNDEALQLDCRLWRAAYLHSKDMAERDYFDHYTLGTGESPWDRVRAQGTSASGENIAGGYRTAQSVLEGWKKSNGHCKNMMKTSQRLAGVGYSDENGNRMWTQVFSSHSPADLDDVSCYPAGSSNGGGGR